MIAFNYLISLSLGYECYLKIDTEGKWDTILSPTETFAKSINSSTKEFVEKDL